MHGCALFRGEEMLLFVEDVGRHNAIDTIAGWMWLQESAAQDSGDKVFYTTGRLTSEMVIKSAQMGVPIVVSRSGITQMGHEIAQRLGPVRHRPGHQQALPLLQRAAAAAAAARTGRPQAARDRLSSAAPVA